MATTAEIQDLIARYKRVAIKQAADKGIDADEAQGIYALAVAEAANRYDPEHAAGAGLQTYAAALYRAALAEAASQARYGVELDAEDAPELSAVEDDEENEAWRDGCEQKIAAKLAMLPPSLRNFALLIVAGDSVREASEKLGMTDRNGRYMVEQICGLLGGLSADAGQGSLF